MRILPIVRRGGQWGVLTPRVVEQIDVTTENVRRSSRHGPI